MSFDALTAHAIRDELARTIQGGRVQRVVMLGALAFGIEVYAHRRRWELLVSVEPSAPRVHLATGALVRASDETPPWLLLLRKYVKDGVIEAITQPRLERVITLHVAKRDDDGRVQRTRLIIEVMGRHSNAVLVDEGGRVLDAVRRAPPSVNPVRPIVPHAPYQDPPPQARLDPCDERSFIELEQLARAARPGARLADLLQGNVQGFSPTLAREVAARATGEPSTTLSPTVDWGAVRAAAADLLRPLADGAWEPTLVLREGAPVAFTPYRPIQFADAELRPMESVSAAVAAFHGTASPRRRAESLRRPLLQAVAARREQVERKRESLQRALARAERAAELRAAGEAILASLAQIAPGQRELVFDGATVELDPDASPLANAERYFAEYRKARDAGKVVPERLQEVEYELRYLDELAIQIEHAEDERQLAALQREIVAPSGASLANEQRQRPRTGGRLVTVRRFRFDGFEVLAGATVSGNEEVTFRLATPDDLWLHARGVPGAHVVIRSGGRRVPEHVVRQAASLAAFYSRARDEGVAAVDVCERRHVRRPRGAPPGLVTYVQERTVRVAPSAPSTPPADAARSAS